MIDTSIMYFVVKFVSNASDKYCSKGITEVRELRQQSVERGIIFQEILHLAVFSMILEPGSLVKDEMSFTASDHYNSITSCSPVT